jgi:hypothetical protein
MMALRMPTRERSTLGVREVSVFLLTPPVCPYGAARHVAAPALALSDPPTRTPAHSHEALVLSLVDGENRSRAANASCSFDIRERVPLTGLVALFCLLSPQNDGEQPRRTHEPVLWRPKRCLGGLIRGDHRRHGCRGGSSFAYPVFGRCSAPPSRSQQRPRSSCTPLRNGRPHTVLEGAPWVNPASEGTAHFPAVERPPAAAPGCCVSCYIFSKTP